jgi:hypothetical protein
MTPKEYADYLLELSQPFDKLMGTKFIANFLSQEVYEAIAAGLTIEFLTETKELIKSA